MSNALSFQSRESQKTDLYLESKYWKQAPSNFVDPRNPSRKMPQPFTESERRRWICGKNNFHPKIPKCRSYPIVGLPNSESEPWKGEWKAKRRILLFARRVQTSHLWITSSGSVSGCGETSRNPFSGNLQGAARAAYIPHILITVRKSKQKLNNSHHPHSISWSEKYTFKETCWLQIAISGSVSRCVSVQT